MRLGMQGKGICTNGRMNRHRNPTSTCRGNHRVLKMLQLCIQQLFTYTCTKTPVFNRTHIHRIINQASGLLCHTVAAIDQILIAGT